MYSLSEEAAESSGSGAEDKEPGAEDKDVVGLLQTQTEEESVVNATLNGNSQIPNTDSSSLDGGKKETEEKNKESSPCSDWRTFVRVRGSVR